MLLLKSDVPGRWALILQLNTVNVAQRYKVVSGVLFKKGEGVPDSDSL
jgi:hypothetical protein